MINKDCRIIPIDKLIILVSSNNMFKNRIDVYPEGQDTLRFVICGLLISQRLPCPQPSELLLERNLVKKTLCVVPGKWVCSACESELGVVSPAEDTQDGLSSLTDTNTGELSWCSFGMLSLGAYFVIFRKCALH